MTLRAASVRRLLGCDPPSREGTERRFRVHLWVYVAGRRMWAGDLVPASAIGSWRWESMVLPVPAGDEWTSDADAPGTVARLTA